MMFHVGQHVVCVDDRDSRQLGFLPPPGSVFEGTMDGLARGIVYTIRGLYEDSFSGPMVRLQEIRRAPDGFDHVRGECGFSAVRFRPLDESRLTVFRQMLVTPPSPELVDEDLDARIADCERAVREALGF